MFISFEGIDGSGKSTQIELLAKRLRAESQSVRLFREPGGTLLSEKIRELLLDPAYAIHPFAELLLFSAARAQLVSEEMQPALDGGAVVISDRFFDSTIAYQGAGREFGDIAWLVDFQRRVTGGLSPFRTYLLDIPVDLALARRVERNGGNGDDRMEEGDRTFYQRVLSAYRSIAQVEPGRVLVLDGSLAVEVLHEQIWADFIKMRKDSTGTRV